MIVYFPGVTFEIEKVPSERVEARRPPPPGSAPAAFRRLFDSSEPCDHLTDNLLDAAGCAADEVVPWREPEDPVLPSIVRLVGTGGA